jgi:hypothetical protein
MKLFIPLAALVAVAIALPQGNQGNGDALMSRAAQVDYDKRGPQVDYDKRAPQVDYDKRGPQVDYD